MSGSRKPVGVNFEKILQGLQCDVQEMKLEFDEGNLPINDDNKNLHQFCERLDFILKFGLRERGSVLGGRKDLWQYFCKCLADRRNIHDGLRFVKANTELKTGLGRSRCFLRYCLVQQCIGDVLQQCCHNRAVTGQFYDEGALMLDGKLVPALLNCLYLLCDVSFELPPVGHDLDVSWPKYARHSVGSWPPPCRTISLSSLCSYNSQMSEAVASPLAAVAEGATFDDCIGQMARVNMEGSLETSLRQRLVLLEEDNALLRSSLQQKVDQDLATSSTVDTEESCQAPSSCPKCDNLLEELRTSKDRCADLQRLHLSLEEEVKTLQTQVHDFQTKEKCPRDEIGSSEQEPRETACAAVHPLTGATDVSRVDSTVERCPAEQSASTSSTEMPSQEYRQKMEHLQGENRALKEQCRDAELEKNTLRTNIRKISEAEEELKLKTASLSQQAKKYEGLEDELDILRDKYEERGKVLQIAKERLTELETALEASDLAAKDTVARLNQVTAEANSQVQDLKFQISSKDMENADLVKADQENSEALVKATSRIDEQEAQIAQLKEAAASRRQLMLTEQEGLLSQVKELTRNLSEQKGSCSCLEGQLQQAENALKESQQSLLELKAQLSNSKGVSAQLDEDNGHLREKIIQLLREKDTLWQSNVRLEGAVGYGREWMDNSSAQSCLGCSAAFSMRRRRHHCRTCGRIFCTGCSDNWIMTSSSSRRVRVCDDCFSVQAELATLVAVPSSSTINNPNDGLNRSLQERETPALQTTGPLPLPSQRPDCDEYAVISDDEVQNSRLSSSPSSGSPPSNSDMTEIRASEDTLTIETLSTSPPTNAEVWVGAGTRVLLPVNLPTGVTLHWNFISEPKNVSFAVLHQPHEDSPERSTGPAPHGQRVLIPTTRVAPTQGAAVRGRLDTKQPGIYTLVFDNSTSRFTARKVTYSMSLKNPAEPRESSISMA